jgi:hypothetical protein
MLFCHQLGSTHLNAKTCICKARQKILVSSIQFWGMPEQEHSGQFVSDISFSFSQTYQKKKCLWLK